MGMGLAVIIDKNDAEDALSILDKYVEASIVGEIIDGKGVIIPQLDISI